MAETTTLTGCPYEAAAEGGHFTCTATATHRARWRDGETVGCGAHILAMAPRGVQVTISFIDVPRTPMNRWAPTEEELARFEADMTDAARPKTDPAVVHAAIEGIRSMDLLEDGTGYQRGEQAVLDLVEFWHTRDHGEFLDDAAVKWLNEHFPKDA